MKPSTLEGVLKKLLVLIAASAALAIVVPAWAAKPSHPSHPSHPAHGKGHGQAKGHSKTKGTKSCKMLSEGYRASGTLTSATLTPGTRKGRFNGTLVADITRANHHAPKDAQTFTLTDARVHFGKGVSSTAPAAGDRVAVHGKVTVPKHGCTSSSPVIAVHTVRFSGA